MTKEGRHYLQNDCTFYWDQTQQQMLPVPAGFCTPAYDGYVAEGGEPNKDEDDW